MIFSALCLGGHRLAQFRQALLDRLSRGVHDDVRLSVEHRAALEYAPQILHRLVVPGHGARVALRDDARHVLLGCRLQPHREARRQEKLVRPGLRNYASPGGDDGALVLLEHLLQAAALVAPVSRLPVEQEDLRQARARLALDLPVELDEGHAERLGELRAQRGLSGAAKPDERDPLQALVARVAVVTHQLQADRRELLSGKLPQELRRQVQLRGVSGVLGEELGERQSQGVRDLAQEQDRHVSLARFQLSEVALGHSRVRREQLARQSAPGARAAHPVPQGRQVALFWRIIFISLNNALLRFLNVNTRYRHREQYNACAMLGMQYDAAHGETQAESDGRGVMALELTILVGTMTGTAQLVAQEVELTLDDSDTRVRTKPMDGLDAAVFAEGGLFLICSSTYGQGDVP